MKKKRAMKAITEDWTDQEEEELRYLIGLKTINRGVGVSDASKKIGGCLCRKAMARALEALTANISQTQQDLAIETLKLALASDCIYHGG